LAGLRALLDELDAGSIRVLAVDDDPLLLAALRASLAGEDIRVATAADAAALWRMLDGSGADALIVDVDMPGVDGIDLCRALRADPRWLATPILFLSARADADAQRLAFAAGADDYLLKPISPEELSLRVRNRVSRARTTRSSQGVDSGQSSREPAIGVAGDDREQVDVVMIDDDAALSGLVTHALTTRGHSSRVFTTGRAAFAALGPGGGVRARVLLLDVDLPDLDGFSVLRRLTDAGITRESSIIMLTVRASEREVLEALQLGAVDHVAKPFSLPVLMQRIRLALER
jgi:DNA-binding response OmpR family regulator